MAEVIDIEEFLNSIERRIQKCENIISSKKEDFRNNYDQGVSNKSKENNSLTPTIQNRLAVGQNSLMANLENEIQELDKVKDDQSYSINYKLDCIESIIKKIFSLGPLENWLSTYETIKAYLEMDSADFESSVLTLDLRKAYIMEHFDEFNTMKSQLIELENLLPFLNQEIDIQSINDTGKRLKDLENRSKRISNETKLLWENLEKLVFSYSNFVYKYNILTLNQ
ncbi:hypothetical protein [Cryptosporidium parvum Iowa II]|uniref:Uncharacterized protein n=2 Tax=Cryptosporidium parvum TaxID=5807 RepID=Q5CVC5_CRYPI|nr:hypothetical protein [Cryptosporidium parvum Iowa II]EAK89594.1 hypothetical protein cgd8_4590 [Cryptosporidium parvum Iowa II]QOY40224.1 Dynactin subunit p22 [Cryptosporidium parvum]WKS79722.1 hypothetical protein CPCDC_8g4590 [Cryptosporidium sp. 43IA8]WRK34222.1 Dynactin subunit p22 [Cryptosporidium parvum]|eukprot:QOY40224.1 hypothetical protein CPATCC_004327 [Cryptosporidium parvum]